MWDFVVSIDTVQKATIHQLTTIPSTSKKSYFPVLTTGSDTLSIAWTPARVIIKEKGHHDQYRWLAGGYEMETGHF